VQKYYEFNCYKQKRKPTITLRTEALETGIKKALLHSRALEKNVLLY